MTEALVSGLRPVDLLRAVATVDPPFYVYRSEDMKERLRDMLDTLRRCFEPAPVRLYLPVFSNPCLPLLWDLCSIDSCVGLLVNSIPEAAAVVAYRSARSRLLFAGGTLSSERVLRACAAADVFLAASVGNLTEALKIHQASVGVRLALLPGKSVGIAPEHLREYLSKNSTAAERISTVHAYVGPSFVTPEALTSAAGLLLDLAASLPACREVNFSGGWPFDYAHTPRSPSDDARWLRYLESIRMLLERNASLSDKLTLSWEPGKFLLAPGGSFVCRVVEVEDTGPLSVDVHLDASFVQIPAPKIKGRLHRTFVHSGDGSPRADAVTLCRLRGNTGLSTDVVFTEPLPLPRPVPGDLLVVDDVGAYGRAGSYNFLGVQLPPELDVRADVVRILRGRQPELHLLEHIPTDT